MFKYFISNTMNWLREDLKAAKPGLTIMLAITGLTFYVVESEYQRFAYSGYEVIVLNHEFTRFLLSLAVFTLAFTTTIIVIMKKAELVSKPWQKIADYCLTFLLVIVGGIFLLNIFNFVAKIFS